ncbi:methionyl-tRNA formyltransferase [Gordonia sp. TBRC 11910]|uniref:Methionyl-tRNA formyltransferase n=1 Tax=Gordonia asplenii TaxID=2725283 RepID=A0A848KN02_9ACTN|nr:methionyl-tRNA formyltransferase [Gordonia asplenii]NMO00444.1 methionyl-tRNA formyltransferase [Gordonia asplenii]
MRVIFAGTPAPAVPSLQALLDSPNHEVVGVLSRPDAVSGRGKKVTRSPIALLADDHGVEVFTPRRLTDDGVRDVLDRWAPDVVAVVAYGALVPPDLLDLPEHGWINLHFSLLPAWRGAAPVQAAIAAGDTSTGASTFRIEAGLDTGPVFGHVTESIRPTDTSGDLLGRLAETGAQLLVQTLEGLAAQRLSAVPQPPDGVSLAPKITVDDSRVRWDLPAHIVDRRIRAHTPAPGAWTELDGARIKVGPVRQVDDAEPLAPGALRVTKKAVHVGTSTLPVQLGWVGPPGKKQMPAADWARGARLDDGQVLA